jgi:hypothetical protein
MRPSFADADPLTEQLVELIRGGLDVDRFVVHTQPIAKISTQQLLAHELTPQVPGGAEQLDPSTGCPREDLRLDLAQGAFFGASSGQHDGPDTSLAPLHGGPDGL